MNPEFQKTINHWMDLAIHPSLQKEPKLAGLQYTVEPSSFMAPYGKEHTYLSKENPTVTLLVIAPEDEKLLEFMTATLNCDLSLGGIFFIAQPVSTVGNLTLKTV